MDSTWMGDGEGMPAPTAEKAALVDLWRSTAGSHCSQNHLLGYLPSSMGRLKFLQKLILNHNLLTGIIPKSFFQLENLEEVNLSHNRLTGSLPKGWGKLEYIRVLHLAHNEWEEKKLPPELYKLQEQGTDVWFNEDTTDPSNADKLLGVDAYSNLYKY